MDIVSEINAFLEGDRDVLSNEPSEAKEEATDQETEEPEQELDSPDPEDVSETEAEVTEPVRKSRAQDRIRELVREKKELEERLSKNSQQQYDNQFAQLKQNMDSLAGENQRLHQALQQLNAQEAEKGLSEVDKAFRAKLQEHLSPYIKQLEEREAARVRKFEDAERRRSADEFKSNSFRAASEHILKGFGEQQRSSIQQDVSELTLAMAAAYGCKPEEAAKRARNLLEAYHEARGDAKKAVSKQKLDENKKAAPAVGAQGRVTSKDSAIKSVPITKLREAGYKGSSTDIIFAAAADNYSKLR